MAFISYDSYKNRIEKLAKFKNFVVKYRFLIIGVLAVIIAGASALMATKGMITTDITLNSASYSYGESYNPTEASAFLSDVGYEYSVRGTDEWTYEKPVKVGKYSVRAVTNKIIGKGYGNTVDFEILPATITFTFTNANSETTTLTYGSDPSSLDYNYSGLVTAYGDRIEYGGVEFDYDYPEENDEGNKVGVTLKKLNIVDKNGNDSSDCYVYEKPSTNYLFGAKSITFKIDDVSKTYSGKGFSFDGTPDARTQSQLVNSDKFRISTKLNDGINPVNAGDYTIVLDGDIKVLDENGKNITYRYNIGEPVNGTFTVKRREVTILSESGEWTYNGLSHSNENYKITSGSLADRQTVTASSTVSVTNVSDGRIANVLDYVISDSSNVPVTDNYIITPQTGTLNIKPRPLTITTEGGEWEYDGNPHAVEKYTASGLADGQTLAGVAYTSVTNVSQSGKNSISYDIVWTDGGAQVNKSNYDITDAYGNLTVTARPLKVVTNSASRAYNGEYLTCDSDDDYTVSYGGNKAGQTTAFVKPGESLSIVSRPQIINVGTKQNAIKFSVPNNNYYIDETKTEYGTLTITQAEITVQLSYGEGFSVPYGEELPAPQITISGSGIVGGSLFGNDKLTPVFLYDGAQATRLGTGPHTVTLDTKNSTFKCDNGEPVTTPNYKITNSPECTLTVGTRSITVTLNDTEVVYGNPVKYVGGYESADGLVSGQTVKVGTVSFGITSAMPDAASYDGAITCPVTEITIFSGTTEVTSNYAITVNAGKLIVKQREITVKAKDMLGIIYGEKIEYEVKEGNYANEPDLVPGEKLTIDSVSFGYAQGLTPTVGSYYITPDKNQITILKADGSSSRSNYKINSAVSELEIVGTLQIVKRPIRIESGTSPDLVYNGEEQYDKSYEVKLDNKNYYDILPVHSIVVTDWTTVTDATAAVQNRHSYEIVDQSGDPVSSNYAIYTYSGYLIVSPRPITVQLLSYQRTYGDDYSYPKGAGNYANTPDLVGGDTLEITYVKFDFTGTRPTVGKYDITKPISCTILKANGKDGSNHNYTVEFENGELEIIKRDITVTLQSFTKTYGDTVTYPYGNEAAYNILTGHVARATAGSISYSPADKFPNAGNYEVSCNTTDIKVFSGTTDVTGNYNVTAVVSGNLTIEQRAITVTLNSIGSVTYGESVAYTAGNEATTNVLTGHTVTVNATANDMQFASATATYPNVGAYTFTCDKIFISISDGSDDVTDNYDITVKAGTLTITAREITVQLYSNEVYYGNTHDYVQIRSGAYEEIDGSLATVDGKSQTLTITGVEYTFGSIQYPDAREAAYSVKTGGVSFQIKNTADETISLANYKVTFTGGDLTVNKRDITVTLQSFTKTYGDTVTYPYGNEAAANIVAGHTAKATAGSISYSPADKFPNAGDYEVSCNVTDIKVFSGTTDVTKNYNVTEVISGNLTIEKRAITVTLNVINSEYGETVSYTAGKEATTNVLKGHTVTVNATTADMQFDPADNLPNVGSYTFTCNNSFISISDGSVDVTDNYDIEVKEATLTITARKVTVQLYSNEVYYGDTHDYITLKGGVYEKITAGSLATFDGNTHTLTITGVEYEFGSMQYPDAREKAYAVTDVEYQITAAGGAVIDLDNYDITFTGDLTVNKRPITVTISDTECLYGEYGNNELPTPDFEITDLYGNHNLINGDKLSVNSFVRTNQDGVVPQYFDAGIYTVSLGKDYSFTNADGSLTVNNYEITVCNTGTLTINKRTVTITVSPLIYKYGVLAGSEIYWCNSGAADDAVTYDRIYGRLNDLVEIGGDGLSKDSQIFTVYFKPFDLLTGDYVECKNVATYGWTVSRISGLYHGDKVAEWFYDADNALSDGTCVSVNYIFKIENTSTLEITQKTLNVRLPDKTIEYCYMPFAGYSFETSKDLAFDETLSISKFFAEKDGVTYKGLVLDVGSYKINANASDAVIRDWEGNRITDGYKNYAITFDGNLTITPRKLTVTLNDMSVTYTGEEFGYESDGDEITERLLTILGHKVEVVSSGVTFKPKYGAEFPNVGEYAITATDEQIKVYFEDEDGTKIYETSNYAITVESGTLKINKRAITLQLSYAEGFSVPYGDEIPAPEVITGGVGYEVGLVNGDTVNGGFIYENTQTGATYKSADLVDYNYLPAGNYLVYLDLDNYTVKYTNGASSTTKNYAIDEDVVPAALTIAKLEITVTLKDFSIVYGDTVASNRIVWLSGSQDNSPAPTLKGNIYDYIDLEGSFAEGEEISLFSWSFTEDYHGPDDYVTNCYRIQIAMSGTSSKFIYSSGFEIESNYDVTLVEPATITVNPRNLVVTLGDITATYGDEIIYKGGEVAEGNLSAHTVSVNGAAEWQYTPAGDCTFPNAGSYKFTCADTYITVKASSSGNDVTFNYDITVVPGNLTINKRAITVTLNELTGVVYGDGDKLVYNEHIGNYANTPDFAYEEQLQISVSWQYNGGLVAAPKNAGYYKYQIDYLTDAENYASKVFDKDLNEIENGLNNYSITCTPGEVTITPVYLSYYFDLQTICYGDDLPLKPDELIELPELNYAVKYEGETLRFKIVYTPMKEEVYEHVYPKDVGLYDFNATECVSYDAEGNAYTTNYSIYVYGRLGIAPREITVNTVDIPHVFYGETVNYPADPNYAEVGGKGLVYDQSLSITSVTYYYLDEDNNLVEVKVPTEVGTYYVVPTFVKIADEYGAVSLYNLYNYDISYPETEEEILSCGTVKILPIKILLQSHSNLNLIYNGEEQDYVSYTLWLLDEEGHKSKEFTLPDDADFEITYSASIKDVGECENTITCRFANYHVEYDDPGMLKVNPRPITLKTDGEEWIYNDEEYSNHGYTVENGLDFHTYSVVFKKTITNKGEIENEAEITAILDEDGNPVINNYEIATSFGTLKVNPRPIVVVTGTEGDTYKVYDGTALINESYTTYYYGDADKAGLLNGDTLTADADYEKMIRAGKQPNKVTFTPDSENYEIKDYEQCLLTIDPKPITVIIANGITVEYGNDNSNPVASDDFTLAEGSKLVDGEILSIAVKYYDKTDATKTLSEKVKDVGNYGVVLYEAKCSVQTAYDEENGFANYEVDFVEGEVTVIRKEITVTLKDINKVYGEKFDGYPTDAVTEGLEYEEELYVTVNFEEEITEETPAGDYAITIESCSISGKTYGDPVNGVIHCKNYIITFEDGTLTVDPRPIIIATASDEKTYDGEYLYSPETDENYTVVTYYENMYGQRTDGIVSWDNVKDVLKLVSTVEIINAGDIQNKVVYELLSDNYELVTKDFEYGYLTVIARPITVSLSDIEEELFYGDKPQYNGEYANEPDLVEDEILEVAVTYYTDAACTQKVDGLPKAVGTYYYKFNLAGSVVTGSKGGLENGIGNYHITCNDKKSVEIKKLTVTVELEEWSQVTYDGNTHEYEGGYKVFIDGIESDFPYEETLSTAVDYYYYNSGASVSAPKNAGDYYAIFNENRSTIGGSKPDANYLLTVKYPNIEEEEVDYIFFTILKKDITISMEDVESVYDGNVYDYLTSDGLTVQGAVVGETIVPAFSYDPAVPKNAGTYSVVYESFTVTGENDPLVENYNLTTPLSELTCQLKITPRKIVVSVINTDNVNSIERNEDVPAPKFVSSCGNEFGFTAEDLDSLTPVYKYYYLGKDGNGTAQFTELEDVNQTIGIYEIRLDFTDNGNVLDNYEITETEYGALEVTARKVTVTPTYSGSGFTYDGDPISLADFNYTHVHVADMTDGFLSGNIPAHKFVFTDEAGNTYDTSEGDAPVNAGEYTVRVEFIGVNPDDYTIYNEDFVTIVIDKCTVTVTYPTVNKDNFHLTYDYSELSKEGISITYEGILDKDAKDYKVDWGFYNGTYSQIVEHNYAGDFYISAYLVGSDGKEKSDGNYQIGNPLSAKIFTVQKAVIYVTPVGSKTANYTSENQELKLEGNDYVMPFPVGQLYGEDNLTVMGSGVLRTPSPAKSVTISGVLITGSGEIENVTGCYDAHFKYEASDEHVGEDWYTRANFTTLLSFNTITVKYTQKVLDTREFIYTGQRFDLGVDGTTAGLITADRSNIPAGLQGVTFSYTVIPIIAVGEYKEWVVIRAYDSTGREVTPLYDFQLTNAEQSKIVVKGVALKLTVQNLTYDELEDAWTALKNGEATNVLQSSSQYGEYGYYKLNANANYYVCEGLKDGVSCEVLVKREGGKLVLKLIVFTESASGKRTERSVFYELDEVKSSIDTTVTLSLIGELKLS